MARAEPTLAWIDPAAAVAVEPARPARAEDGGAAFPWGLGVSTLIHAGLIALLALWVVPHLEAPPPSLEIEIVAAEAPPPVASAPAPEVPRSGEPTVEQAPEPPPVDSASLAPPTPPLAPPPPEPEEKPAPPPPEPAPAEAAKPAEPKPQPKPQPPRPRVPPAPQPQIASRPAAPTPTPVEPGEAAPKARETAIFKTVPGVTASGRTAQLRPLSSPPPAYPRIALQLREEGTVVLSLEIDAEGHPIEVTVLHSSGFGSLDQAALQAARSWRFQAPMQEGRAVAAKVEIPFVFKFKRNP